MWGLQILCTEFLLDKRKPDVLSGCQAADEHFSSKLDVGFPNQSTLLYVLDVKGYVEQVVTEFIE